MTPYGVYDVGANAGWVSVGITSDTAEFAVASIRQWLNRMGRKRYPDARELTITADCGGSNGARVRLWKIELQRFADETGLVLNVHHYPPGTSKWNRIEHRLFCHITQTWRGRPLTDRMAVVELIAATTTKAGLKIESALDTRAYEKGIKAQHSQGDAQGRGRERSRKAAAARQGEHRDGGESSGAQRPHALAQARRRGDDVRRGRRSIAAEPRASISEGAWPFAFSDRVASWLRGIDLVQPCVQTLDGTLAVRRPEREAASTDRLIADPTSQAGYRG